MRRSRSVSRSPPRVAEEPPEETAEDLIFRERDNRKKKAKSLLVKSAESYLESIPSDVVSVLCEVSQNDYGRRYYDVIINVYNYAQLIDILENNDEYDQRFGDLEDMTLEYRDFLLDFSETFPVYARNKHIQFMARVIDTGDYFDIEIDREIPSDFDGNVDVSNQVYEWAEKNDYLWFFHMERVKKGDYVFLLVEDNVFDYQVGTLDSVFIGSQFNNSLSEFFVPLKIRIH